MREIDLHFFALGGDFCGGFPGEKVAQPALKAFAEVVDGFHVVEEDGIPLVPTTHDVINRSRIGDRPVQHCIRCPRPGDVIGLRSAAWDQPRITFRPGDGRETAGRNCPLGGGISLGHTRAGCDPDGICYCGGRVLAKWDCPIFL